MRDLGPTNAFLQGIYTDIDSLFDTRFAVLEQVDQLLALTNLKKGWATREADVFEGIDKELFDKLYESRDLSVLELAQPTQIIDPIRKWIHSALQTINGSPNGDKVVLFVNVWPYLLTREKAREFGSSISESVGGAIDVRMINVNPEEIDTETAAAYFSAMFIYDWDTWLESNAKSGAFAKRRIPDVTLYAPKIFKKGAPTDTQRLEIEKDKVNVFEHFEMTAGPQIGLEFIEAAFFCHRLPQDYLDHFEEIKRHVTP